MGKNLQEGCKKIKVMQRQSRETIKTPDISGWACEAARLDVNGIFNKLASRMEGLSREEAETRLEIHGLNEVPGEKPDPWFIQLFRAFVNPFVIVLLSLAVVSLIVDVILAAPAGKNWGTVTVIALMIAISGLLSFYQEYRSNRAAEQLEAMVRTTATVSRGDQGAVEVPMAGLVPGDIIRLSAGDMIPADVRIFRAKDLFVNQAALTGEAEAVEKFSSLQNKKQQREDTDLLGLENIGFMGTNVISGTAGAVVISTGERTHFGRLAKTLTGHRARTSFDRGVNNVSILLIRFMLVMVPIVFVINGFTKGDWFQALLFAVSVAVGLTPEMLPVIVTTNLAKGAYAMAKNKTVVKKLNAIQNFGAMDVLCTDKTGTLTLNKVVLVKYLDIHGQMDERVLRHAYLNSFYQTGLKNLLDVAIIESGRELGFTELDRRYGKVDEIPFDFARRRMSVVLESENEKRQLVTKGALEEMLSICSFVEYQGQVIPFTEEIRTEIMAMVEKLSADGMRVVAVAQKNRVPDIESFSVADESSMVLIGYLGFLDPPKESAKNAIGALQEHGVAVKVLTGDNEIVTQNICRHVGLDVQNILLGPAIEAMNDRELAAAARKTTIFAKLTPLQKSRIITALQNNGHTVGFLGDGINDAPALRDSDIGISVDTATDIAKESADIILLEKDLMVLEQGVVEGRNTFGNIIKYIKITASSNFGNMFSVLGASAFLPFLPMLPIHLLLQNLSYDLSQVSIPWDKMDPGYIKKPRQWNADDIKRFMIFIGPISSIFDLITFLVMWHVFRANSPAAQSLFQSGWFVEGLLSQILIVHMIRTRKIPFFQSRATAPVFILTAAIIAMGVLIPFTALGRSIGLQPLPLSYFPWLAGILLAYSILTQVLKTWYIRRFKMWL